MPGATKPHESHKHAIIKQTNLIIVIAVSVTIFISVFSLFAVKALMGQSAYQQNVIDKKNDSLDIAKQNNIEVKNLEQSYQAFATAITNIIGGNAQGTGPQDGPNPKIVLDSLPSEYDFPALSSSMEKLLTENGFQINKLGGSETVTTTNDSTINTELAGIIDVPYALEVTTNTEGAKKLLDILERSIRPFYVEGLEFGGSDANLQVKVTLKTFYQPATKFEVKTEAVE